MSHMRLKFPLFPQPLCWRGSSAHAQTSPLRRNSPHFGAIHVALTAKEIFLPINYHSQLLKASQIFIYLGINGYFVLRLLQYKHKEFLIILHLALFLWRPLKVWSLALTIPPWSMLTTLKEYSVQGREVEPLIALSFWDFTSVNIASYLHVSNSLMHFGISN